MRIQDRDGKLDTGPVEPGEEKMKIRDIIREGVDGTIHDVPEDHRKSSTGIERFRDVGGYDRVYHLNRIGMATAMADGKSVKPVAMKQSSWYEKYNTAHPYTDEEHNMIQSAFKTVDSDHSTVVKKSRSQESSEVHRVSPVQPRGPVIPKKHKSK